jgi:predicted dehydrogenase
MSSEQPIRIGIIGTGIFAHRHHRAYQAVGNNKFQIVACANRSQEKALAFAKEVKKGIDKECLAEKTKLNTRVI